MLKWILGGLAVLILVVGGTCWYGYKKMTEGGDTAEVAIAGDQARIFAAMANTDSMALWMSEDMRITPLGRDLAVGDTLRLEGRIASQAGSRQNLLWIVREVTPPSRIVLDMADDSTKRSILVRHDELIRRNDSTIIVVKIESPIMDSARISARDSSKFASGMMGTVQKVMVGAMRLAAEADLKKLKARVEGTATP